MVVVVAVVVVAAVVVLVVGVVAVLVAVAVVAAVVGVADGGGGGGGGRFKRIPPSHKPSHFELTVCVVTSEPRPKFLDVILARMSGRLVGRGEFERSKGRES